MKQSLNPKTLPKCSYLIQILVLLVGSIESPVFLKTTWFACFSGYAR